MALYALGDLAPDVHPEAFVHPDATLIGAVSIGPESSVWPHAVLRGDSGPITVGARTSVQDGSAIHVLGDRETVVGDGCVIGHLVHMEGCVVEDGALVGSGAIVLPGAIVRSGALVGAAALVPEGLEVPSGAMALGVPARLREGSVDARAMIEPIVESYVARARRYRAELRRLD